MRYPRNRWIWAGHACHLCVGSRCQFHMATTIGPYVVSTVGEFYVTDKDTKPTEIGWNRLYETMVFKKGAKLSCGCSNIEDEIDSAGYNKAIDATKGHMKMCEKYANRKK